MHAELVPLPDGSDGLTAAWAELAQRAAEPNPFFEPYFVLPAARHLGVPPPELLIAYQGSRLAACMPVVRGLRLRRLPVPYVGNWRHLYSPLGTPLLDRELTAEAMRAMVDRLLRTARPHRLMVLEWIGQGGPVGAAMEMAFATRAISPMTYRTMSRGTLQRQAPAVTLAEGALGKGHGRLRRLHRAFERELGAPLEAIDRSGQPEAVDRFLGLEASGWKGRRGTAMARRPGHADFFREMCAGASLEGKLELLSLEAAGRVLAMKCSLFAGDGLFYLKAAYDETHARYSPGVQLELAAVERFQADGRAAWIDSCTSEGNETIGRLFPEQRTLSTVLVPPGGSPGRVAVGTMLKLVNRQRAKGVGST